MANISGLGVSVTAMVSTQHMCELCPKADAELPFLGAFQGCLQEALKATSQLMKAGMLEMQTSPSSSRSCLLDGRSPCVQLLGQAPDSS